MRLADGLSFEAESFGFPALRQWVLKVCPAVPRLPLENGQGGGRRRSAGGGVDPSTGEMQRGDRGRCSAPNGAGSSIAPRESPRADTWQGRRTSRCLGDGANNVSPPHLRHATEEPDAPGASDRDGCRECAGRPPRPSAATGSGYWGPTGGGGEQRRESGGSGDPTPQEIRKGELPTPSQRILRALGGGGGGGGVLEHTNRTDRTQLRSYCRMGRSEEF